MIKDDEQLAEAVEKIQGGVNDEVDEKTIRQLRVLVKRYLCKELVERNKGLRGANKQKVATVQPLLDLLVTFDRFATSIDFFSSTEDAHDLFPLVFKLCFYNDKQYSVTNHPLD